MKTVALAAFALALAACGNNTINTTNGTGTGSGSGSSTSSSSSSTSGTAIAPVTQTVSGTAATSVLTTDGSGLNIPASALSGSTVVTVTPTPSSTTPTNAVVVGTPYVISASAALSAPVTVTLSFDPSDLGNSALLAGTTSSAIVIQSEPTGLSAFFPLATTVVDSTHVSVQTTQVNATFVATVPLPNCDIVIGYPGNSCAWGVAVGSTFPDVSLAGGAILNFSSTPVVDSASSIVSSFTFAQLQAASAQGFRYAFLDISAVWCPHCNDEAATLPGKYVAPWLAEGGVIFSILVEGGSPNASGVYPAASQSDLTSWISEYKINYPMSIDAQQNMVTTTGLNAWPANIIVRLSDMTVIDSVFGATDAFYQEFAGVLLSCSTDADCWSGATCSSGQCQ